jgi:septum site-determining protein MinD
MDPWALKAFEFATSIFVITTADVIVINQTKRVLSKIQELLFPPEMVQIVVNRYNQSNIINPQIIQKNLNRPIFAAIPEDVLTCDGSLAKSSPLCISAANTPISRAYHDIVRKIQQVNLFENLARLKKPTGVAAKAVAQAASAPSGGDPSKDAGSGGPGGRSLAAPMDPWTAMKLRIHKALVEQMDLKKMNTDTSDAKQRAILREKTQKGVLDILNTEDTSSLLTTRELKAQMVKEVGHSRTS